MSEIKNRKIQLIISLAIFNFATKAVAMDNLSLETESPSVEVAPEAEQRTLSGITGYKPNSLGFSFRKDGVLDPSIRGNLSFLYEFEKPNRIRRERQDKLFFSYTGVFDFYIGVKGETRESAPVVGRVFNPGLHYRRATNNALDTNTDYDKWTHVYNELSLLHRSNGQTSDARLRPVDEAGEPIESENYIALTKFQEGDLPYIDSISRTSNYFQYEAGFRKQKNQAWFSTKVYIEQHEDNIVTWRGTPFNARFSDYDRFQFTYAYTKCKDVRYSAQWTIGDKGFAGDSIQLTAQKIFDVPFFNRLPMYVKIHHGPMETLSDHTLSVSSIAAGIRFFRIYDKTECGKPKQ